jgi:radical SAM superfamily enzyme YgiQ (UPF0313 family)
MHKLKMTPDIRLVLIVPPQHGLLEGFVNGLVCLANYISQKLPDVKVDFLNLSTVPIAEIRKVIQEQVNQHSGRLVVGISTLTAFYQASLSVARAFKELRPESTIVLGGHHVTADAETVLRHHRDIVDFIIVGEGEAALAEFLLKLDSSEVTSTPGLAFLDGETFHKNPLPAFLNQADLDAIPNTYGDHGLLGISGKFGHTTLITARGCPHRCSFCAVANEKIRAKSVDQVAADIVELTQRGYVKIAIEDNFFAHSPRRTRELCEALTKLRRRGVRFTWDCQTRVESMMRDSVIKQLSDAGCEAVYLGVESVCPDQLLYLRKTLQPEVYLDQLHDVVKRLLDSPIDTYLNIQFGLPGETAEHLEHTHRVLTDLGSMAHNKGRRLTIFPQLFVVYPGTEHYLIGVQSGKFFKDIFESFTEWEASQSPILVWLGEHFAHGTGGLPEGILNSSKLAEGIYDVDTIAIGRISNALRLLMDIPGIEVFDYKSHLINEISFSCEPSVLDGEEAAQFSHEKEYV